MYIHISIVEIQNISLTLTAKEYVEIYFGFLKICEHISNVC